MADAYSKFENFAVTFPAPYVAHVQIDRARKLNAFTDKMFLTLRDIFQQLDTDANVRAILVSGAGDRAFTSGLDVEAASTGEVFSPDTAKDPARIALNIRRHILGYQSCVTAIETCATPVLAVLHGYSYGMAIDMSSACDMRLCAADTQFCVKEIDIGLAADVGTLSRLPKIVGSEAWVKEISLTARVWGAQEALRVGFVSEVCATKDEGVKRGLEICKIIAAKSPVAAVTTKEFLNYSRDHTVQEGLRHTASWNAVMLQTEDVKKAIFSGLKKRTATFEKL